MSFSKSFPKTSKGSTYPTWEEVFLDPEEEKGIEKLADKENLELMKYCLDEAKTILSEKNLKDYQSDVVQVAIALFNKISSHVVYWKESKCKEKFDEKFNSN
jgi:hypothetical protein